MSHDIRTPMNAIMGMTELAQHHPDEPEKLRDYLQKIASSGTHLLGLINEVLDVSKIESGTFSLEEADFEMCIRDRLLYNGQFRGESLVLLFVVYRF